MNVFKVLGLLLLRNIRGNLLDPLAFQITGIYDNHLVIIGGRNESVRNAYVQTMDMQTQQLCFYNFFLFHTYLMLSGLAHII